MATGIPFGWQVENSSGVPVSGAKVYTYKRGTTTAQTAYTDSAVTVPAANPIVADAAGWFNAYLNPLLDYTVVIKSADDSITYQTRDYYAAAGSAGGTGNPFTVADTLAELQALEGDDSEDTVLMLGRAAAGDGGGGIFRWLTGDQSSSVTSDTTSGIYVAPASDATGASGCWKRVINDNTFYPEWFGTSSDWGAAWTAAFVQMSSGGGILKGRPGADYTLSTQVSTALKSFVKIDISGCKVRQRYTSGAQFKIGTGASDVSDISVIGDMATYIDGGTTAEHPLFELRGVQRFHTRGLRGDGLYQIAKWGDVADVSACYEWFGTDCSLNMRTNANGGHSHAIAADGSEGGLYLKAFFCEGDAANVVAGVSFFRLTSAQGPARFDGLTISGGNIKYFDIGLDVQDARIVNINMDPSARIDDSEGYGIYVLCQAAASQGGCEEVHIRGEFGGTNGSGAVYIRDEKGTVGFDDITVDIVGSNHEATMVRFATSGSGAIRNVHVKGVNCSDFNPGDGSQRVVTLDGDIAGAVVDNVALRGKSGASFTAQYVIYNNTASTKRVKIGPNVQWDSVNTAVIYDPNVGDMSIGRFCALRPDGTPRGGPVHLGPFTINNVAASVTNGDIGIRNDGGLSVLSVPAFDRCRVIGLTASLLGTPAAGTLTINANPNAAGANTNLQVAFTSASGANPRARVLYPAGTASIAAAGSIRLLYTTDGSWSPTTSELCVYQIVQEM